MKALAYIACAALVVGFIAVGCGKTEESSQGAAETVIMQKTCPVMAGPINNNIFVEHEGRKIYFCCAGCKETFKKDPDKYIKKVDEELKKLAAPK